MLKCREVCERGAHGKSCGQQKMLKHRLGDGKNGENGSNEETKDGSWECENGRRCIMI